MSSNDTSGIPFQAFTIILSTEILAVSILQCLTLPLFLLHSDYRSRIGHQMMLCIGIADLAQIVPYFFVVFCSAFAMQMAIWMENIVSALNILFWDALVMLHLLLALNRSITVIGAHFRIKFTQTSWETKLFKALISAVFAWTCCWTAMFQTPLFGGRVDLCLATVFYNSDLPYSGLFQHIEVIGTTALLSCTFCLYLAINVVIKKNKPNLVLASGHGQQPQQNAPMNSQERRIFLQALALFCGMLVVQTGWFLSDHFDRLANQLWNYLYVAYFALNPLLYLTMNPDRFLYLYSLRREEQQSSVVVPMQNLVTVAPGDKTRNIRAA